MGVTGYEIFWTGFLQRVSDSLNIADVIGSYVPLKKEATGTGDAVRFIMKKHLPFPCLRTRDCIIALDAMRREIFLPLYRK